MGENQMPKLPEPVRYFALALDPIHVGTGGYRLGRVDMGIVREPGTNLPKIPGTSIAGACRTYAAMQESGKFPGCAGQKGHCGAPDCPICVTFGFSKGEGGSFQGLAQFADARLAFFPVHSLAGPVWVTCPDVLRELDAWESNWADPADEEVHVASGVKVNGKLNLGWLMLDVKSFTPRGKLNVLPPAIGDEILNRAVLVPNKMFVHIVNDNLEVRTSVSIDPQTGAAESGALYTYEALPRASVLWFDVVMSDPKYYRIPAQVTENGGTKTVQRIPLSGEVKTVKKTVEKGLALFESLGVGGMSTRGMGRMRVRRYGGGEAGQ